MTQKAKQKPAAKTSKKTAKTKDPLVEKITVNGKIDLRKLLPHLALTKTIKIGKTSKKTVVLERDGELFAKLVRRGRKIEVISGSQRVQPSEVKDVLASQEKGGK